MSAEVNAAGAPLDFSIRLDTSEPPGAPQVTLQTYALAAVAANLDRVDPIKATPEIEFLRGQLNAATPPDVHWMAALDDYLRRPDLKDARLIKLAADLGLTLMELLAVALAVSVEEDVMIGRGLAHLQAPLGGSRPTLGLLATSLSDLAISDSSPIDAFAFGAAVQTGLIALMGDGVPLPERTVRVPLHLCRGLKGYDGVLSGTQIGLAGTRESPLPPSIKREAERHAKALRASAERALVLRTGSKAEGRSVASAIAGHLQLRPLFIETDKTSGLAPWLLLRELLPIFCFELGPGERKIVPAIPFYRGPVLVLCGPDGSLDAAGRTALSWSIPVPPRDERRQLWQIALGSESIAEELAAHHRHSSGRIAQLGGLARHQCTLDGRSSPSLEDVAAAAWSGEGAGLESLAQPLRDVITDEAMVTTPELRKELDLLLLRCRSRDQLVDELGASTKARYHPGVRALLIGPSGTGKTLAAGWLATQLGLPLYRVDLASVTSKYIGETEKNLAQLLARAEHAEVVLLFDEADSLFGKRTEVRDANDRFANAQTNYLLQRIESFDGVTLLTSNSRARFDSAFSRRLDMIIEFPAPGPEEQRMLWQSHLGANHRLSPKEINQLAATADFCGGHIRNVVLMAAMLAQANQRPVEYADVIAGLAGEYKKLGRQMPVELTL